METKGIVYIVASGEKTKLDFIPTPQDLVIAADGGYDYLTEAGIRVDLLVGDMDSIKQIPNNVNRILLCKEKDDTDTLAAVRAGLEKGYREFRIYCATGSRMSHTYANIQVLEFLAKQKKTGLLISDGNISTVIHNEERIIENGTGYISIFSLSPSTTVTISGLKYNIKDKVLTSDFPIGVSNEFIGKTAKIHAQNGSLLIIYNESVTSESTLCNQDSRNIR